MAVRPVNLRDYEVARERMVREEVFDKGIRDRRVLKAMLQVPRHLFLDAEAGTEAYTSHAFPIGFSQTMSQPYMVAYLSENLELAGDECVLEIGTGSGYHAAVLAALARRVFTIERIPDLARKAEATIRALRLDNVVVRTGDGAVGWPKASPFDRILLTAAATGVPEALLLQLRPGGFLLGPVVGDSNRQEIVKLVRTDRAFELERLRECSFVPLIRDEEPAGDPTQDVKSV
jgi:protein-L-isoaspartate(D-aspartate) O-methyltransferase